MANKTKSNPNFTENEKRTLIEEINKVEHRLFGKFS